MLHWFDSLLPEAHGEIVYPGSILILAILVATVALMVGIIVRTLITHELPRR